MKKKLTLTDKLIAAHATSGTLSAGEEVGKNRLHADAGRDGHDGIP